MGALKVLVVIIIIVAVTYSALTYAANRKVERQQYRLVKKIDNAEIRFYPKTVMATVSSRGDSYMGNSSNHFRTLAGYIFGGNKSSQKIAMTAPVHMEKDSAGNTMSFVMPSGYDITNLPQPNDNSVDIHYSEEGYFAAIKFGGYANEHKINTNIDQLKQVLADHGLKAIGSYSYLGYNSPWDVIGRENEIIVQIAYTE